MMTSLRIAAVSIMTALRYPRVWLALWTWITVASLILVIPIYYYMDQQLSHHPGASYLIDQSLDVDMWRENKNLRSGIGLTAASAFAMLGMVFFAGGILACLGVGRKFRFAGFLGECARLFPRNLRVFLLGLIPALLLFWIVGLIDKGLPGELFRNWDPGGPNVEFSEWIARFFSLEVLMELLRWFWGLLFLLLVFAAKVAMAHLCIENKSLATWAWLRALRRVFGRPIRSSLVVIALCVGYLPLLPLGGVIRYYAETEPNLWAALGYGQLAIVWLQIISIAFFLSARRFLLATAPLSQARLQAPKAEDPVEPTVAVPRKVEDADSGDDKAEKPASTDSDSSTDEPSGTRRTPL